MIALDHAAQPEPFVHPKNVVRDALALHDDVRGSRPIRTGLLRVGVPNVLQHVLNEIGNELLPKPDLIPPVVGGLPIIRDTTSTPASSALVDLMIPWSFEREEGVGHTVISWEKVSNHSRHS